MWKVDNIRKAIDGGSVVARCPGCGAVATFDKPGPVPDLISQGHFFGSRVCPNAGCNMHIFFVKDQRSGEVLATFPPQQIDFHRDGVPESVANPMQEAITCHANGCFHAAALMVRRTLEVLCEDQGCQGKDLNTRIAALGEKVVISKELLAGMHDLRLLGNDAAHVELKDYDDVGADEATVAIELGKTLLEVVYQHKGLVERLRGLKKQPGAG
jgi:hypothetical protein